MKKKSKPATASDPVLAAIANLKALRTVDLDEREAASDDAYEVECAAERAVVEAIPTTPAGAAALIRFAADHIDELGLNDAVLEDIFTDAIRNAVAVLEREARA
jgi:hypothetical protein